VPRQHGLVGLDLMIVQALRTETAQQHLQRPAKPHLRVACPRFRLQCQGELLVRLCRRTFLFPRRTCPGRSPAARTRIGQPTPDTRAATLWSARVSPQ
jgi:hypothetical protein